MRLPRRVPWASVSELEQVCSWIFTDEFDLKAKRLAVDRLAAWRNITSLPHAIESTHAILSAILQDSDAQGSSSFLSLRQTYATAIIRLVNGLVDPLQLGAYARSIASIATQLGLPPWLVELRHAATHEDLPSIELLRQAGRDAMTWLLNNYWLPTLNPSVQNTALVPDLRSITPLFKRYKSLLKAVTRDASLRTQYQPEITKVMREVERWIAEAKVASNLSLSELDWDVGENPDFDRQDAREKWALGRLCEELVTKGALVPQSKKKRLQSTSTLDRAPVSLPLWKPLIEHINSLHSTFPSVLVSKITAVLLNSTEAEGAKLEPDGDAVITFQEPQKTDLTYDLCLASWAYWLVDTYAIEDDNDESDFRKEDVIVTLISGLGPNRHENARPDSDKGARLLLTILSEDHPELQEITSLLASKSAGQKIWTDADLLAMTERLEKLLGTNHFASEIEDAEMDLDSVEAVCDPSAPQALGIQLPPGWRHPNDVPWKATPIGVYVRVE